MLWRRSYDVPPPPLDPSDSMNPVNDPRYAGVPPDVLPLAECLKDVVERMLPYWYDAIVPDLTEGKTVLVTAHGNSLRALVKHLDEVSDDDIVGRQHPDRHPAALHPRRRRSSRSTAAAPTSTPRRPRRCGRRGQPGQEDLR